MSAGIDCRWKNDPYDGVEQLRRWIRELMEAQPATAALKFNGRTTIQARCYALGVSIDGEGRCSAVASELLVRYAIHNVLDTNQHQILIGAYGPHLTS